MSFCTEVTWLCRIDCRFFHIFRTFLKIKKTRGSPGNLENIGKSLPFAVPYSFCPKNRNRGQWSLQWNSLSLPVILVALYFSKSWVLILLSPFGLVIMLPLSSAQPTTINQIILKACLWMHLERYMELVVMLLAVNSDGRRMFSLSESQVGDSI